MYNRKYKRILFVGIIIGILGGSGYLLFRLNLFSNSPEYTPLIPIEIENSSLKTHEAYLGLIYSEFINSSEFGMKYYFSTSGNDNNNGKSPDSPFRSFESLQRISINPGDFIFLRCGDVFTETLTISMDGNQTHPIVIAAYQTSNSNSINYKPIIKGDYSNWYGIEMKGNFIQCYDLEIIGWKCGIGVNNDVSGCRIAYNFVSSNMIGITLGAGTNHTVDHNILQENNKMIPNRLGVNDDYGAMGILVHCNNSEFSYNLITGHIAGSSDYGADGSAFEIYGGSYNYIHHNLAANNLMFTELGKDSNTVLCIGNIFEKNMILNDYYNAFLTQHIGNGFGPIFNTTFRENIIVFSNKPMNSYGACFILNKFTPSTSEVPYLNIHNNTIYSTYHPIGNFESTSNYISYFNASNGYMTGNIFHIWQYDRNSNRSYQTQTDMLNNTNPTRGYNPNRLYYETNFNISQLNTFGNMEFIENGIFWS